MHLNKPCQTINLGRCRATTIKRFANYLIDFVVFYILAFGIIRVIGMNKPKFLNGFDGLTAELIFLLIYGMLMCLIEAMFNGKSLGKLITGTRAVNANGSDISFQKAFIRNMVRAVPFIAFSALGNPCMPWHDRLSNTIVIDEKKLALQIQRVDLFNSVKNQTL